MEESRSLGERPRELNSLNKRGIILYTLPKNIKIAIQQKYRILRVRREISSVISTLLLVTSSVRGGTLRGRDSSFPNVA